MKNEIYLVVFFILAAVFETIFAEAIVILYGSGSIILQWLSILTTILISMYGIQLYTTEWDTHTT